MFNLELFEQLVSAIKHTKERSAKDNPIECDLAPLLHVFRGETSFFAQLINEDTDQSLNHIDLLVSFYHPDALFFAVDTRYTTVAPTAEEPLGSLAERSAQGDRSVHEAIVAIAVDRDAKLTTKMMPYIVRPNGDIKWQEETIASNHGGNISIRLPEIMRHASAEHYVVEYTTMAERAVEAGLSPEQTRAAADAYALKLFADHGHRLVLPADDPYMQSIVKLLTRKQRMQVANLDDLRA